MTKKWISLLLVFLLAMTMVLPALAENAASEGVQLTETDIQAMSDGKATFVYNDRGHLTTLIGNFYDGTVMNFKDAIKALTPVKKLLGIVKSADLIEGMQVTDDKGNTVYTLRQISNTITVRTAVVKVLVDKTGKAFGLTSSLQPGITSMDETIAITADQAMDVVKKALADKAGTYTFYPESTQVMMIDIDGKTFLSPVYAIYTDNPGTDYNNHSLPYLVHFVGTAANHVGEYLGNTPNSTLTVDSTTGTMDNRSIFLDKEETTYTGTVKLFSGKTKTLTVPVLYDKDKGLYYLADPKRQIAVGNFKIFMSTEGPGFPTSKDNTGWEDETLLAYENYIKIWDIFASYGIKSVDGAGTPIMILADYTDALGKPIYNAAYVGKVGGWQLFFSSSAGGLEECIDVLAHEYTHGITSTLMGDNTDYRNEFGAINESYSDIMGNIVQGLAGNADDSDWLIAETTGTAVRSMSNPLEYKQPEFVGDAFYGAPTLHPRADYNDNGGVHYNSSFLNYAAYQLNKAGMTLETQKNVWLDTIIALTPTSNYKDVYALLLMAMHNYDADAYQATAQEAFQKLGILDDLNTQALAGKRDGYGRLTFKVKYNEKTYPYAYVVFTSGVAHDTGMAFSWPNTDGLVTLLLPEGTYYAFTKGFNEDTKHLIVSSYAKNGWSNKASVFTIKAGEELKLPTCYLK